MSEPKQLIDTQLHEWFLLESKILTTDEAKLLLKYVEQVILRAGKRARPRLLYLTYEAYGGIDSNALLDVGLALELHHQFLLIHDDVMDGDLVRYDGPNVAGLYLEHGASESIASSMAILAGNLLFSYADQIILASDQLTANKKVALLKLLHHANNRVQQGQQLDILDVTNNIDTISEQKLLAIDSLKTASYTVHLPMQMAAELIDLPATERTAIKKFAEAFGILYQLVDDYSDYFENTSTMNTHPKFRDFRQGKITYPLWHTLQHVSKQDKVRLLKQLGNKTVNTADQAAIVHLLKEYKSDCYMAKQISTYRRQALKALHTLNVSAKGYAHLHTLLDQYQI